MKQVEMCYRPVNKVYKLFVKAADKTSLGTTVSLLIVADMFLKPKICVCWSEDIQQMHLNVIITFN